MPPVVGESLEALDVVVELRRAGAMLLAVKTGRRRGVAVMTTALFVIFLTIKLAVYPAIGVMRTPAENNLAGFVHDIDAALVKNPEIFTQDDLAMLERAMPLTQWRRSDDEPLRGLFQMMIQRC